MCRSRRGSLRLSNLAKYWVGLGISAVLLALFFLTVDAKGMLDAMWGADYAFVVPAIAMYQGALLFRSLRWRMLLAHMKSVPTSRLYPVVVVGYMANNLLPLRMGELVRAHLVGEREGVSKAASLMTIFVERVLDALTLLLFISATVLFVPLGGLANSLEERYSLPWPLLTAFMAAPFIGAFGALIFLAHRPDRSRSVAASAIRLLPQRLEARLLGLVDMLLRGLVPLQRPGVIVLLLALSIPIWLFEVGLFYLIGQSLRMQDLYEGPVEMAAAMVLVMAIANIWGSVPATPGGVGIFELAARETMVLLPLGAVDRTLAGGFAALTHAALILPMIVQGQALLWWHHLSLGALARAGGERLEEGAQGGRDRPEGGL